MDDDRIWAFEESLWTGDAENYRAKIDDACLMSLPATPFVFTGEQAIAAVSDTPGWSEAHFSEQQVARPQEGLIVIAYRMDASKDGNESYVAYCTSTYRRLSHEEWRVVQHAQVLQPTAAE